MTLRIGIIGAENSHALRYATAFNVEKAIPGMRVDYIWGERPEFAEKVARVGQVPHIVKRPRQMLAAVDAVIVDHRHAKPHLSAALPFVERGVPAFIDKPFCYRVAEGRDFLRIARKRKTPVTSFSILPDQRSFRRFKKSLAGAGKTLAGALYGPCDIRSEYGGVFFYGIHQVAMALEAFGYNVGSTLVAKSGGDATGQLIYPDGLVVTLNFIRSGCKGFHITAVGEKRSMHKALARDADPFSASLKKIAAMFKTGKEPETHERLLAPIAVLEALGKSVKSGRVAKVARITL